MKIKEYLIELRLVLDEVHHELEKQQNDEKVDELEFIGKELSAREAYIMQYGVHPKPRPKLISARLVTDTWLMKTELGERITALDYLYRNEVEYLARS